MAAHYSTQADGSVTLVVTSFAARKAARVAAGQRLFKFEVVAKMYGSSPLLGSFASQREAMAFAYDQRGPLVGNTSAHRALSEQLPRQLISMGQLICVERVNTGTGERLICRAP